jgi:hypothetical protein
METILFALTVLGIFILFLLISGIINFRVGFRFKLKKGGSWYKVGWQGKKYNCYYCSAETPVCDLLNNNCPNCGHKTKTIQ